MSKSYIWSGIIALAIVGWFGSGYILPTNSDEAGTEPTQTADSKKDDAQTAKPFLVGVKEFNAVERRDIYPVRGTTEASKIIEVRARTSGIVENQTFDEGDLVKARDLLCKLDTGARKAQMARAQAQLTSAKRDYDAALKLSQRQFAAKSRVASDKARMELAQAELAQIELDMKWTEVQAPSNGVIHGKPAQTGSLLQQGGLCATLHVMNPMLVVAQVPERLLPNVNEGMQAAAKLITGEQVSGEVKSIAMSSDRETRTFRVELEVPNENIRLREGVTTELYIELPAIKAHKLPSSALTLADNGDLGTRIVVDGSKVKFMPLRVLSQEADGAWVSGLPDTAMVIVKGQDFVTDGQTVDVAVESGEAS